MGGYGNNAHIITNKNNRRLQRAYRNEMRERRKELYRPSAVIFGRRDRKSRTEVDASVNHIRREIRNREIRITVYALFVMAGLAVLILWLASAVM